MNQRLVMAMTDLPFTAEYWSRLQAVVAPDRLLAVEPGDEAGIAAALQEAEIAILAGDLDHRHLEAPKLRWVHVNLSGMTQSARPEVFERGLIVTGVAGLGVGLAAAFTLSGTLEALLYGVQPRDVLSFVVASAALLVVTLLAAAIPAWRAVRVDPVSLLRAE